VTPDLFTYSGFTCETNYLPSAVGRTRTCDLLIRTHSLIGGLLEWDMWAWIDRNRLARPHMYASIGPQIWLSRVAIGLPPRYQQTTDSSIDDRQ
jgi:hypothetical protein